MNPHIRPVTPTDLPTLKTIIDANEMFPSELLDDMIAPFFTGETPDFWLTYDPGTGPVAVTYCVPEQMTEGTWNLLLIAVDKDQHSQGIGQELMAFIEQKLAAEGQRVLLVETSDGPEFKRTRSFYHQLAYQEAGRIPEFYTKGEGKVIFYKKLQSA